MAVLTASMAPRLIVWINPLEKSLEDLHDELGSPVEEAALAGRGWGHFPPFRRGGILFRLPPVPDQLRLRVQLVEDGPELLVVLDEFHEVADQLLLRLWKLVYGGLIFNNSGCNLWIKYLTFLTGIQISKTRLIKLLTIFFHNSSEEIR